MDHMAPDGAPLILVVDDEPQVRRLMRFVLRDRYRVLVAADGREALALWSVVGRDITAVVTDLRMPDIDGLALAHALRRMEPPPPILFVSGYGSGGELPGPFLQKPFPPDDLLVAVEKLLGPSAREARRTR
jgi:CheY-like chemotaxis protein